VLPELSRIITQFARSIRWADDRRFTCTVTVNAEGEGDAAAGTGTAAALVHAVKGVQHFIWTFSDVPLRQFPDPPPSQPSQPSQPSPAQALAADGKDRSSLRVWTIRIDTPSVIFMGIGKPSPAAGYDADSDEHTISVTTANGVFYAKRKSPAADSGVDSGSELPYVDYGAQSLGALYHFTADLSTGCLRVRPVLPMVSRYCTQSQSTPPKRSGLSQRASAIWLITALLLRCTQSDGCTLLLP
jgi:hypothetical protein